MSFNIIKKGVKIENIKSQTRNAVVENLMFEKKLSPVINQILVEEIVGRKFPGYIKGSEYQIISIGNPIEKTIVKVTKYPKNSKAVGKTFALSKTIGKWGRTHPLVQGLVAAVAAEAESARELTPKDSIAPQPKVDSSPDSSGGIMTTDFTLPTLPQVDIPSAFDFDADAARPGVTSGAAYFGAGHRLPRAFARDFFGGTCRHYRYHLLSDHRTRRVCGPRRALPRLKIRPVAVGD